MRLFRGDVDLQPLLTTETLRKKLNYIHVSQFAHQSVCYILLTTVSCEIQQFVLLSKHRCDEPHVLTK
jgi:hypothetical protein